MKNEDLERKFAEMDKAIESLMDSSENIQVLMTKCSDDVSEIKTIVKELEERLDNVNPADKNSIQLETVMRRLLSLLNGRILNDKEMIMLLNTKKIIRSQVEKPKDLNVHRPLKAHSVKAPLQPRVPKGPSK